MLKVFSLTDEDPVLCFPPNRSSLLDQAGPDGQEALGRPGCQHRQIPLCRSWEPDADHPLAEKRQRVQGGAEDGRHQGRKTYHLQVSGESETPKLTLLQEGRLSSPSAAIKVPFSKAS